MLRQVRIDDIQHGIDDVLDILIAHPAVDGQGHRAQVLGIGNGQILRAIAVGVPVIGMHMQRNEMHAGTDVPRLQFFHELGAVDAEALKIQAQRVEVPCMLAVGPVVWRLELGTIDERGVVSPRDFGPPAPHAFRLPKLSKSHSRSHVSHVVLEPRRKYLVVPRTFGGITLPCIAADAVQRHHPAAVGQYIVIGADHAAFTGGDRLRRVEREAYGRTHPRVHLLPDHLATVHGREGMCCILDDGQVVLGRYFIHWVQVRRKPSDMNRDDGARFGGQRSPDPLGLDVQAARIDIHQHGTRVEVADDLGRGRERVGGRDDFVARPDAHRLERQMHGRGTRVQGNSVPCLDRGRKLRFELLRFGACGNPAGLERLSDLLQLGVIGVRQGEGQEL